MDLQTRTLTYDGPDGPCIGTLHWDNDVSGARAGVLVAPTFRGVSPFEQDRARELAALGYAAMTTDYYGGGALSNDPHEAHAWKAALDANRPVLAARMEAALAALKAQPEVEPARTAGIGYCLGGKAVLDLARQGADIKGVVTLHGVLDRADTAPDRPIPAAALILHGWDDPLALPESVEALAAELTARGSDWQVHAYGHTGHAFTNPAVKAGVQDGFGFSLKATARAWRAMVDFLADVTRTEDDRVL